MLHLQSFTFNFASENTYLLFNDGGNAWLFDPGNWDSAETAAISHVLDQKKLTVTKILLTHAHIDHVLGLQWAVDRFRLPVTMHTSEREVLDMLSVSGTRFGIFVKPVVADFVWIDEGETLNFDGETLKVLHVPGHSPGSLVYHHEKEKFLISGDTLFQGSIGRTDLYKGDYGQLVAGISKKLFPLPPETKVYSGHGQPTSIGFEKDFNPFFKSN